MKKLNLILLVLMGLGLGLFLAGCSQTDRTRGTAGSARMTNSDLEDSIKAKLNSDPDLRTADLKVSADTNNNEVKITGTVASEALRNRAIDMVKSSHAGLVVTDKIDVEPKELSRSDNGTATDDTTTGRGAPGSNNPDRTAPPTSAPPR